MKKIISIILTITIVFATIHPLNNTEVFAAYVTDGGGSSQRFSDLPSSHYATESVNKLVELDIINGLPDGTFRPDNPITIESFVKMTVSALGYTNLPETGGHWANSYINKAIDIGLFVDDNNTIDLNLHFNFRRTQFITRKEVAFILNQAAIIIDSGEIDYIAGKKFIESYIMDFANIDTSFRDAVIDAYGLGLIAGFPDKTFRPNDNLTRAQAAICIYRLLFKEKRDQRISFLSLNSNPLSNVFHGQDLLDFLKETGYYNQEVEAEYVENQFSNFDIGDKTIIFANNGQPFLIEIEEWNLHDGKYKGFKFVNASYEDFGNANKTYVSFRDWVSTFISFTPVDTIKDTIDFIKGEDIITGEKINRYLLGMMIITPEAIDIAIKKGAKNGEDIVKAIRNTNAQGEQIINGLSTYEQARNLAMDLVNLGPDSKPYYGRLSSSIGYEQIIGRQSADGKISWRLDYDPNKGIHINVEDYSEGKKIYARKYAITFEGNEETYRSLIKHLNR